MIIMFVVMAGLIFYMNRTQKKQAEKDKLKRVMRSSSGGLTVDGDAEKRTVVLDVDGVIWLELTASEQSYRKLKQKLIWNPKVAIGWWCGKNLFIREE